MRSVAFLCRRTGKLPQDMADYEIEDYLVKINKEKGPSDSYFKHTIYGLRYVFKLLEQKERALKLPTLRHKKGLPVVLSREECRRLFCSTDNLKHRVLMCLIYSSGLRMDEARRLKWKDIDRSRMQILVRQGKNRKDRYVVLSGYILQGLEKYYRQYKPQVYVFNGNKRGEPMGRRSFQWIINEVVRKSGLKKEVTCHTLRHTFATHLLEDGVDILTIKEQLGHSKIQTTLIYTHIARVERRLAHSPLDTLYNKG
jgi:site-specific recombinase XerD